MESQAIQIYDPCVARNLAIAKLESGQRRERSLLLVELIGDLENFSPLEGANGISSRRSPLPLWYPRRPLQDITAIILNSSAVVSSEISKAKKVSTKSQENLKPNQATRTQGNLSVDSSREKFGGMVVNRAVTRPVAKLSSTVASVASRGLLLRKGFR